MLARHLTEISTINIVHCYFYYYCLYHKFLLWITGLLFQSLLCSESLDSDLTQHCQCVLG